MASGGEGFHREPYRLPKGWVWVSLGELAEIRNGVTKGRDLSRFETVDVPYLRVANVQNGYLDLEKVNRIWIKTGELEKYRLRPNDILFTEGGDRDKLGRGTVWQGEIEPCIHQNHIHCVRLIDSNVDPKWISLASQLPYARDYFWKTASQTVNLASLNASNLRALPIPLPSKIEQDRILEKIESAIGQIRSARVALVSIPSKLKALRQSVLAAAFRGELTEREPDDEPAEVLLERIRSERRRRWEEGLREKGKDPAKLVYPQPPAPDTSNPPKLPEGWVWTTLGAIGEVSGGLTKNTNRVKYSLRYPYISVANVYADELRLNEVGEIGVSESEVDRTLLQTGDLLIVEGNGSADQIGRVALWDGRIEKCLHQNHIIKVRLDSSIAPRFTLYWLLSPLGREAITKVASSTSGLYTLNLSKVGSLPVPVPPIEEQNRIISKLDSVFMQMTDIRQGTILSTHQLENLEQAALAKAFRGELG